MITISNVPNMHQHPCHESLPISLWLNHILTALEEKKSMGAGMKVLWIQDTAISTEKMSADDSEWLLCVKIAHHWTAGPQQMQRHKSRWNQVVFCFFYLKTETSKLLLSSRDLHMPNLNEADENGNSRRSFSSLYTHVNIRLSDCSVFTADLQNDERRGDDVRVTTAAVR